MEKNAPKPSPEFTGALTKKELCFAAAAFVLHLFVLPPLTVRLIDSGRIDAALGNFIIYAFMTLYVFVFMGGFLRRDFDPLVDSFVYVLLEVADAAFALLLTNYAASAVLLLLGWNENPNNTAITDMAVQNNGMVTAMAVFLAPIVEEVIFRGALFGGIRRVNRVWAYAAAIAVFGLYHVRGYLAADIKNLVFLIQYIPAGFLLCRCYERTNTVWAPIILHMLVNAVSMQALG